MKCLLNIGKFITNFKNIFLKTKIKPSSQEDFVFKFEHCPLMKLNKLQKNTKHKIEIMIDVRTKKQNIRLG